MTLPCFCHGKKRSANNDPVTGDRISPCLSARCSDTRETPDPGSNTGLQDALLQDIHRQARDRQPAPPDTSDLPPAARSARRHRHPCLPACRVRYRSVQWHGLSCKTLTGVRHCQGCVPHPAQSRFPRGYTRSGPARPLPASPVAMAARGTGSRSASPASAIRTPAALLN